LLAIDYCSFWPPAVLRIKSVIISYHHHYFKLRKRPSAVLRIKSSAAVWGTKEHTEAASFKKSSSVNNG
jgi:hypothetical protein